MICRSCPKPFRRLLCIRLCLAAMAVPERVRADDAPSSDVVVMQQMIVEATRADDHPDHPGLFSHSPIWLYVSVPDCEILSRCDPEQTVAVARHIGDSLQLNRGFIPDEYVAPLPVPMSFIMFDDRPTKAMKSLMPTSGDWAPRTADFGRYFPRTHSLEGGTNTGDLDTHCTVQNRGLGARWMWAGGGGRGPIPTGSVFQLSRCTPALPLWYQYGFDGPTGVLRMIGLDEGMIVAKATWISEDDTDAILAAARKGDTLPTLPPIEDLFRHQQTADGHFANVSPTPAWMAEAALFVRWGLFDDSDDAQSRHKAFAAFVERSRDEPITEKIFRECFGFGYAEMQSQLSRYLVDAAQEPICVDYQSIRHWSRHPSPDFPAFPNLDSREATPSEIARLLGDWERMQGNDLRSSSPALSQVYLEQAGKTLHESYSKGERDPQLLAVLGMYDYDVGATEEARAMLTAAVDAGVSRPTAYLDLAALNYNAARAHPGAAKGKFNELQTAAVLKPLFAIRSRTRLDAKGYLLIAEAWGQCAAKPNLKNLAVLYEGMEQYPFDPGLLLSSAETFAQWGYVTEANTLIGQRLRLADDYTAKQLLALQETLKAAGNRQ